MFVCDFHGGSVAFILICKVCSVRICPVCASKLGAAGQCPRGDGGELVELDESDFSNSPAPTSPARAVHRRLTECPTCGHGAQWASGLNVLWACDNSDCGNEGDKYCYECGNWDIWISKCRCPYCEKVGKKLTVFTGSR